MSGKHHLRDALSGLVDLALPLRCPGCGAGGTSWCAGCARELGRLRRVDKPLLRALSPAFALGRYAGAPRRAVLAYKESGRRDLAEPFARALAAGLRGAADQLDPAGTRALWLVPAPSRSVAARRRGGSHMLRVAQRCAPLLADAGRSADVADCLALRRGARDSVGLGSHERLRNLSGNLLLRADRVPPERCTAVLVDDVITTAATAASCLSALEGAGLEPFAVVALTATAG